MKICIFCSANNQLDAIYFQKTAELGRWCAEHNHPVVFGGCNLGLMECVAKAAHEAGGQTIGVVPHIIEQHGKTSDYMDVHVPCDDLNDRKALMLGMSDVFIALPGGIGTLDEVFTVVASRTIGYHRKRIILYNMEGFWSSAMQMLDDLSAKNVIRGDWRDHVCVANTLEEIEKCIAQAPSDHRQEEGTPTGKTSPKGL